jgi:predicted RNA-binding protein with EMAP domain
MGIKMKKFIVERDMPNVALMPQEDVEKITTNIIKIVEKLEPEIEWVNSYITQNKVFSVYLASSEEIVRIHSQICDLPVTGITEIIKEVDPVITDDNYLNILYVICMFYQKCNSFIQLMIV